MLLPLEIEQLLAEYCTEQKITRKDKNGKLNPALGTGVINILQEYFLGSPTDTKPNHKSDRLSEDTVQKMIREYVTNELPGLIRKEIEDNEEIIEAIAIRLRDLNSGE